MKNKVQFTNICPIFISDDVQRTVKFYTETLGFKYANHIDKIDNFATIYKDSIEIVIVQKQKGHIENNTTRYGNGYDAYIDTDSVKGVDIVFQDYVAKGVHILVEPRLTDYGCYEFVLEDIDGRKIGIGLIKNKQTYFKDSDFVKID